jgi:HEAT repeat protein
MAAARGLGCSGRVEAVPLLQFKALIGDDDPRVVGECFSSLLCLERGPSAAFAADFLSNPREELAEAAALALGESALPEAFEALRRWWQSPPPPGLRHTCLLALGLTRRPEAFDLLFDVMTEAPLRDGLAAVAALGTYRHDDALAARAREAAERRGSPELLAAVAKAFPAKRQ